MGRRALRKIDPSLDLSRHLLEFEQLPKPWDVSVLFGRAVPLEIEVGTGKGLFLRNAASGHPEIDFLGIEIAHKYAKFAAAGLAKAGLTNARVVSGDGLRIFAELIPEASLAAVHVYFPDPWWKKRHRKRRVFTPAFAVECQRCLRPGGLLHAVTDVEDYYGAIVSTVTQHTRLRPAPPPTPSAAEHDLDYLTNFERKFRKEGRPIYRATCERGEGEV